MVTVPPPWRPFYRSVRHSLAAEKPIRLVRHRNASFERAPPLVRRRTSLEFRPRPPMARAIRTIVVPNQLRNDRPCFLRHLSLYKPLSSSILLRKKKKESAKESPHQLPSGALPPVHAQFDSNESDLLQQ
jgi:hypothetical protein